MKELMATSRNVSYVVVDSQIMPMIEVALSVGEPAYSIDAGGELVRQRLAETLRFSTHAAGLRTTAESMLEWAAEAEAQAAAMQIGETRKEP